MTSDKSNSIKIYYIKVLSTIENSKIITELTSNNGFFVNGTSLYIVKPDHLALSEQIQTECCTD